MSKSKISKLLAIFAIASLVLTACGGGGGEPAAEPDAGGPKVTSSGFECPEPNPRVDVTSTELNLFVWTEYFPQDMLDCFELVYDIKLNRDEYSSNEEMYAKLSAGGTAYDLAQPTDYIVPLMIRQAGCQVATESIHDDRQIIGVNTPEDLARCEQFLLEARQ